MSIKVIQMHHKVCDHTCMWNGIEDLYERRTGNEVPDYFFFCMSGIGNFAYLKFNRGEVRRIAAWNDGRTKKMYQQICSTVGFTYKHIEGRTFEYTLRKAKEMIELDTPVVLGCLDMYYLEYYPKFYHQIHIPIHYVLMVGYNEEEQCIYVQDCGMSQVQKITYKDLEQALNIEKTSLSDKNTLCHVDFSGEIRPIRRIAEEGLRAKAEAALNPQTSFAGIPGMRKLAREIPNWINELTPEEYKATLMNLTVCTGTVPNLPDRLRGLDGKDDMKHCAVRDRLGNLLANLGKEYQMTGWVEAGALFLSSGELFQDMTDIIVDYLLGERKDLLALPDMISRIADLEEEAYKKLL